MQRVVGLDMGSSLFGPKEIDGLRFPPDEATDHLLTCLSCLGKVVQVESYAVQFQSGPRHLWSLSQFSRNFLSTFG